MSITVLIEPNTINTVNNPVAYALKTDNYITTAGALAGLTLEITANNPVVNDVFTMAWGTESESFIVKAAPNDTGNQVTDNAGALNLSDFTDQLAVDLRKNYRLSRDFTIERLTAGGEFIIFKGFVTGTAFAITLTEALGWMTGTIVLGQDTVFSTNFKTVVQVWGETGHYLGDYELQKELDLTPNSLQQTLFEIQEMLNGLFIDPGYDLPVFAEAGAFIPCEQMIRRFFIKTSEKFGNPLDYQEIVTQSTLHVINGGVNFEFWPGNDDLLVDYLDPGGIERPFLTWQPTTKRVAADQKEWLYWMDQGVSSAPQVRADIYYTDGTTDLQTLVYSAAGQVDLRRIYRLPVGFNQVISAVADPLKIVKRYEAYVFKGTQPMTEKRNYVVDRKARIDTEYMLFKGSWGGFDTVRCFGERIEEATVTKQRFQEKLGFDYDLTDNQFTEINTEGRRGGTYNTGYITQAYIEYLYDMMLSRSVWVEKDQAYLPVLINNDDIRYFQSENNLWAMEFEWVYAFNDENYSRGT